MRRQNPSDCRNIWYCQIKALYISIAKFRPKTTEELLKIYGLGEKKIMDYGEDMITLLCSKFIGG